MSFLDKLKMWHKEVCPKAAKDCKLCPTTWKKKHFFIAGIVILVLLNWIF